MFSFLTNVKGRQRVYIRQSVREDFPVLAEIHHSSFARGWSDGEFAKLLGNESYVCLTACRKTETPIGFILYRNVLDEAEIITIAVSVSARRKGVAQQLLDASIRNLQFSRVNKYFLEVDENNSEAIALYKKSGFSLVARREGYYSPSEASDEKRPAALVMERQLS